MSELDLALVVRIHSESNTADIKMLTNGYPFPRVPIMCDSASSNTGSYETAQPDDVTQQSAGRPVGRMLIAVVGTCAGAPIILGFLSPQNREVLFADGRCINRRASDVYTSIDDDGNIELAHPSGTYIRIGESPEHEDLTGKDFNAAWKIRRNTERQVHLYVSMGNGGEELASLHVDPNGNLMISVISATIEATGQISLLAPNVSINGT